MRGSDSPFVERITHVAYGEKVDDVTTPDGCWDLVVQRHTGRIAMLQTGIINLVQFTEMARGGHYSSLEAPEAFVDDMRGFAAKL